MPLVCVVPYLFYTLAVNSLWTETMKNKNWFNGRTIRKVKVGGVEKPKKKTIYTWKFDVKIDYLQSAFSLKIRPVLISSSAIAVTLQRKIRDCSQFNVKDAHMTNPRSRNSSTLPRRPHVQNWTGTYITTILQAHGLKKKAKTPRYG